MFLVLPLMVVFLTGEWVEGNGSAACGQGCVVRWVLSLAAKNALKCVCCRLHVCRLVATHIRWLWRHHHVRSQSLRCDWIVCRHLGFYELRYQGGEAGSITRNHARELMTARVKSWRSGEGGHHRNAANCISR